MAFVKAQRKQSKLRLALCGVSGAGKTTGALTIAKGMGAKKIAVIDTERKSAALFDDIVDFDIDVITPPFTPEKYIEKIHEAERLGYEVIIIDSLTHAWAGEGGILDLHGAATDASKSKNSYYAWRSVTPQHNALVEAMLQSSAHVIATMRSKTEYVDGEQDGKKVPHKIGLAPIQREGMDYEFTVVLDIDKATHVYSSSKDRTRLFENKPAKIDEKTGEALIDWLMKGKTVSEIIEEHIKNINSSTTIVELRESFDKAILEESHIKLSEEFKKVIEAKDKKKLELAANDSVQQAA
jgi:hypothetical protein